MSSVRKQVQTFLDKCDELNNTKFIMAPTKIKDILRCIANSPDLLELFKSVTDNFDYISVKKQCLITTNDGVFKRSYVVLPSGVGAKLAFIFCLFVEFDKGSINFNDFLHYYFHEDGSYFAGFKAFTKTVVQPLIECIHIVYKTELEKYDPDSNQVSVLKTAIEILISTEKEFISAQQLSEEDKTAGLSILDQLALSLNTNNYDLTLSLVCGYNYFVLYTSCVSDGIESLFDAVSEYGKSL